jgi:hypothetical protein
MALSWQDCLSKNPYGRIPQPTTTRRLEAFQEIFLTGLQERPPSAGSSRTIFSVAAAGSHPQNFLLGVYTRLGVEFHKISLRACESYLW